MCTFEKKLAAAFCPGFSISISGHPNIQVIHLFIFDCIGLSVYVGLCKSVQKS